LKRPDAGPVPAPFSVPQGLGLGCWAFGDMGTGIRNDDGSIALIREAIGLGVIHLDTAQSYGEGHSEEIVGRAVRDGVGGRRDAVFIATKAHATSATETEATVVRSLARMGLDRLDLFYIHWPHKGLDSRPMVEALERLRARGSIRGIGVSNFSVEQMEQVSQVGRIDAHELCYNLLWRYPERDVIPYCRQKGIALVTYSTIAQGLLSDTPRGPEAFAPGDARARTLYYRSDVWPRLRPSVEAMQQAARRHGAPLSDAALQWVLAQAGIRASLVGARSRDQLARNTAAARAPLDPALAAELQGLSAEAMRVIPDEGNIFLYYP